MKSALPPWLQVLVAVAGITGVVLTAITLYLRHRAARPRLAIEPELPTGRGSAMRIRFRLTNTGHVPLTVSELFVELAFPGRPSRRMAILDLAGEGRHLPFRLEPDDNAVLSAPYILFYRTMKSTWGNPGPNVDLFFIATTTDGRGRRHEADPYRILLNAERRPEGSEWPERPLGYRLRVDAWVYRRRLRRRFINGRRAQV